METITLRPIFRSIPLQIDCLYRPGYKGAILYIEGLGCSRYDFAVAADYPELKDYTLAAFDFPGMGSSPYPGNLYLSIDDLVDITDMVASRLELQEFTIAGHSMGGLVALLYTEKYLQHVSAFINIEGNLAAEDCFFSRRIASCESADTVERLLQSLIKRLSHSPEKGLKTYSASLELASAQACLDYSRLLVDYSDNGGLLGRYTALSVPTVFIYGEQNRGFSYLSLLKSSGCRTVEIARSGHFLFHDNPGTYCRAITDFVNTVYS